MPRLVVPKDPTKGILAANQTLKDVPGDEYKDRLVKYIPAESVAFFAFVDKALIGFYGINNSGVPTTHTADSLLGILPWAFLILGLIGTPVYLHRQRIGDQPWKMHATISTVAFLLWAYTLGGSVFLIHGWYHALVAAIAAPFFTFIAGWFEPT